MATVLPLLSASGLVSAQPRYDFAAGASYGWQSISNYKDYYSNIGFNAFSVTATWREKPGTGGSFAPAYNFPRLSLSLTHSTLGDVIFKDTGGQYSDMYTLTGNFSRDLYCPGALAFGYDMSLGAGYTADYYNRIDNYQNWFLGGPFVLYASGKVHLNWQIALKVDVEASFGICHNSSARLSYPNSGLNYLVAGVGARYWLQRTSTSAAQGLKTPRIARSDFHCGWGTEIYAGGGVHACAAEWQSKAETMDAESFAATHFRRWPMASAGVDIIYRLNGRIALGVTAEAMYASNSSALRDADLILHTQEEIDAGHGYGPFSAGAGAVQEIFYKNVALYAKEAVYLVRKTGVQGYHGPVYEKVGFRYYPPALSPFFFTAGIKAHMVKADYLEFSVGIRI